MAKLALDNYAASLAGRRVYLAIGNNDQRVSTAAATRFSLAVFEEEERRALKQSYFRLLVVDDSAGHRLGDKWRDEGTLFLLSHHSK